MTHARCKETEREGEVQWKTKIRQLPEADCKHGFVIGKRKRKTSGHRSSPHTHRVSHFVVFFTSLSLLASLRSDFQAKRLSGCNSLSQGPRQWTDGAQIKHLLGKSLFYLFFLKQKPRNGHIQAGNLNHASLCYIFLIFYLCKYLI